ncbi:sensor histidine kinase [Fodinibius sp. AD559]|uniref:sensor histidine kinase n=1 Tax=Fodinibius sp. AD559 TaxID=3424179 RepID=UPI004046C3C2
MIYSKPFFDRKVITFLLFIFGVGWILGTDYLGATLLEGYVTSFEFNIIKGLLFITIASAGLYGLLFYRDKKINQHQRLAESILDATDIGIAVVNREGEFVLFNEAFESMAGYQRDRLEGLSFMRIVPDNQKKEVVQHFNYLLEGKAPKRREWVFHDSNNNKTSVKSNASLLASDQGGKYVIVALTDITEQKQLQAELRQALEEKKTLLAEIVHRVNNNFSVITGLMKLQTFNVDNRPCEDLLLNNTARIQAMATVQNMLYQNDSFTHIEMASSIRKVTTEIVETFQAGSEVDLSYDLEEISLNINQMIPCGLILSEVLSHALQHGFDSEDNKKLKIQLRAHDGKVTVLISDNWVSGSAELDNKDDLQSLELEIIKTLTRQLEGTYTRRPTQQGTTFSLDFPKKDVRGIGNAQL